MLDQGTQMITNLLVLVFIDYGEKNKKNTFRDFKFSTCPESKTTCQGDSMSGIFLTVLIDVR